jgi:hypothetical protein
VGRAELTTDDAELITAAIDASGIAFHPTCPSLARATAT